MSFKNIKFDIFKELFSRGRCNYVPVNFCVSDASIAVTSKDAASIFGSTKAGLPQRRCREPPKDVGNFEGLRDISKGKNDGGIPT